MKAHEVKHGRPVALDGTCFDREGQRIHGKRGQVVGVNAVHTGSDGQERVNVRLEGEGLVSVPLKAIRKR